MKNPFPIGDPDRHAIWNRLVAREIEAFAAADWSRIAGDFLEEAFSGIDAGRRDNPDSWELAYPDLDTYRSEWERQAEAFRSRYAGENPAVALHGLTSLRDIDVRGDAALARRKTDGRIPLRGGGDEWLRWQTLYRCRRVGDAWKICGLVAGLPNPMGGAGAAGGGKRLPQGASQHATAGPYSPALEVGPGRLVVISGQAALDREGRVVGDTIEEQTRVTLENCFARLGEAGCVPADVFKVNIYMTDLDEWERMNAVYREMMPEPRPVRTAVQGGLLFTLKVEIEMWAVKP